MNNGKLCISISAETVDGLIEKIRRAEAAADVIEIRFDHISESELDPGSESAFREVLSRIFRMKSKTPWIVTFRPDEQGGHRGLSLAERESFWKTVPPTEYRDVEEDVISAVGNETRSSLICSHHEFASVPTDIDAIYGRLAAAGSGVIKIAYMANDITDTIPIWHLLRRANSENKKIIPIAMGDAGKYTRILGLAHGAFLTYAAMAAGGETAPGQVTAEDLSDVYRVKQHVEDTHVFGVIGDPISQSLSPYMHNSAFAEARIDAVFVPLLVKDIGEFMRRMVRTETREVELNFGGFSVTMPHKQSIMPHLDVITPMAAAIGAVNTVRIQDGKLVGYNTDVHGFIAPLDQEFGNVKDARVAVLGAGGAARAVIYALKQDDADVTIFARDPAKGEALANEFEVRSARMPESDSGDTPKFPDFDILVDTTPTGMKEPLENVALFTAAELRGLKLVYDLVTKPNDTPIIREARYAGIPTLGGVQMLVAQGARQFEIWTDTAAPIEIMRTAVSARLKQLQK